MVAETHIFHIPALLKEVIGFIEPSKGKKYIDCTLGEGGLSQAIIQKGGSVLALEADPQMLPVAAQRLKESTVNAEYKLVQGNFSELTDIAKNEQFDSVDGIILDLGLSSRQLQFEQRGFTFQQNQPLDMRYDPEQLITAADILNELPQDELIDMLITYAEEERWAAKNIAKAIIANRPLVTTLDLIDSVEIAVGKRNSSRIHPATKVFMGLRIVVNADLQSLELALPQALDLLKPGGKLLVIGYQSLEDRIVKQFFKTETTDCICPTIQIECNCNHKASVKLIRKGVITPSLDEISQNPASRSAKLRIAEKLPGEAA
jgi:16S rRNA (cytosine1402-N4)-methyltransferase